MSNLEHDIRHEVFEAFGKVLDIVANPPIKTLDAVQVGDALCVVLGERFSRELADLKKEVAELKARNDAFMRSMKLNSSDSLDVG